MSATLSAIAIYPIKSCRGIALQEARVERRGIAHDRRFMVVDAAGQFITQREEPRMALVDVAIEGDALRVSTADASEHAALEPMGGNKRMVRIWRSTVAAEEVPALSVFFTSFLKRDVHVVFMPQATQREVNEKYAAPGDHVSFADGYPLLLASEASRTDLEERAGISLVMTRFRPNIVVQGTAPWAEDAWSHIHIADLTFRAPKPCARCVMTTLDPETALGGKEPLKTLATFRKQAGEVMFGVNLLPDSEGVLKVGMSMSFTERELSF